MSKWSSGGPKRSSETFTSSEDEETLLQGVPSDKDAQSYRWERDETDSSLVSEDEGSINKSEEYANEVTVPEGAHTSPVDSTSTCRTWFNFTKSYIGSGILSFPDAWRNGGILVCVAP